MQWAFHESWQVFSCEPKGSWRDNVSSCLSLSRPTAILQDLRTAWIFDQKFSQLASVHFSPIIYPNDTFELFWSSKSIWWTDVCSLQCNYDLFHTVKYSAKVLTILVQEVASKYFSISVKIHIAQSPCQRLAWATCSCTACCADRVMESVVMPSMM